MKSIGIFPHPLYPYIPEVEPSILLSEFFACEEAVKAHPDFQAALPNEELPTLI